MTTQTREKSVSAKSASMKGEGAPTDLELIIRDGEKGVGFWRFLWPYMREYRKLIWAALFFNCLHGVSVAFQTVAPKYLIDQIILAKGITTQTRYQRLAML